MQEHLKADRSVTLALLWRQRLRLEDYSDAGKAPLHEHRGRVMPAGGSYIPPSARRSSGTVGEIIHIGRFNARVFGPSPE